MNEIGPETIYTSRSAAIQHFTRLVEQYRARPDSPQRSFALGIYERLLECVQRTPGDALLRITVSAETGDFTRLEVKVRAYTDQQE